MAILNHDKIITSTDQFVDTYINISTNMITFKKVTNGDGYIVEFQYNIYDSQNSRMNNLNPIYQLGFYNTIIQIKPSLSDIYTYCYSQLKLIYPSYSDC